MQYLPKILKTMNTNVPIGMNIANFVNFSSVFFTGFFVKRFGRKTLMLVFPALMVLVLTVISACLWEPTTRKEYFLNYTSLVMIILFIAFFEFSMGPILWLYNAEIMNNKSSTLAAGVNWITVLIVSNFTPYLL